MSCPLLLVTALGSVTRFLGDAGCFLCNLSLQSVAADGGRRQSIWDFKFWILDFGFTRYQRQRLETS
ncbi:hypothetical protein QT971_15705 [Microcoleus sp. herbarium19]|uniref:hypothetical protein n=1 Tax=unclassified Microcoleus TaxID=2642155 RepID=UPI002FD578EA